MVASAQRFHLGCGDIRLDGFVNVDVRPTSATDRVVDLRAIEAQDFQPAACFFSHAFFEHLPRYAQLPHLSALHQALVRDGFVCYLGLPDFQLVARAYLEGGAGVVGPVFDLYNVYRYTHGDPEGADGYYEQLHKALFDVDEVSRLVQASGFASWFTFRYCFPDEAIPLNLGFYATLLPQSEGELTRAAQGFLAQFDGRFIQLNSIQPAASGQRVPLSRLARGSRPARLFQRACWAAAVRLAKLGRMQGS